MQNYFAASKLVELLKQNTCSVTVMKLDSTKRTLTVTLKSDVIVGDPVGSNYIVQLSKAGDIKYRISAWDVDNNVWTSFIFENIQEYQIL